MFGRAVSIAREHHTHPRNILGYGFLEHSPNWLKKRWAHHRFLLFEKAVVDKTENATTSAAQLQPGVRG